MSSRLRDVAIRPSVVALGGGHGLYASLSALRLLTNRITAVVTVADDGGSSGRLRDQLPILPPGDLRMALGALRGDDEDDDVLGTAFEHRFRSGEEVAGHAVGNLLLAGLFESMGDPVAALALAGRLVGLPRTTRVLPMTSVPLDLVGEVVRGGVQETVVGQEAIALANGSIASVGIIPANAPACAEAVEAVHEADWVVLGPGSWYSSVIPHFLVPELHEALVRTQARRALTLNLSAHTDETPGYTHGKHLTALKRYAPELRLDCVFVDHTTPGQDELAHAAEELFGARLVSADVLESEGVHSSVKLAAAYGSVIPHTR